MSVRGNQGIYIEGTRYDNKLTEVCIVDDIFEALLLDKEELLEDIQKGNSLSKSFLACVDECVSQRESKAFWKGL